jgi:uncharacterized protein with NAD-binding domain and iron-sulfur cluster
VNADLAIVGGGLAGLAAAVEATGRGLRVELFEQARFLGGRAGSLLDSPTGQLIDYCPHVALGCCTEFLDFCRRTGIVDCFQRSGTLHFIGPDGVRYDVAASRWLPAPFHLLPALMRLKFLSLGERLRIVRTLRRLMRLHAATGGRSENSRRLTAAGMCDATPRGCFRRLLAAGYSDATEANRQTIGAWLRAQGQSPRAIESFWSVVLTSALGETVDHASVAAAGQVFRDGFLASRGAGDLWLPRLPLREMFHGRVLHWLTDRGVRVHLGTAVRRVEGDAGRADALVLADGTRRPFERLVVAVPWHGLRALLAPNLMAAMPAVADVERIEPAAITAVHLWFDRPAVPLPHAVLVGRLGQWVFADSVCQDVSPLPLGEGQG